VNGSGLGGLLISANYNAAKIYTANNPTNEASLPTLTPATEGFTNVQKLFGTTGNSTNIAALAPARLAALTGSGGYLTVAAAGETVPFPVGGEWNVAVPVGLKVIDSNATGADVSLPSGSWGHNLHVAAGANLVANAVTITGGTTSGNGTITTGTGAGNGLTFGAGSTLNPGSSPGILNVTGDVTLAGTYAPELAGPGTVAGTDYDQLNVVGAVTAGGTLSVQVTGPITLGQQFTIINNDDVDPVIGTFASIVSPAGTAFTIDYAGGTGNDVVLTATAVPEPGSLAVIAGLAGAGMLSRRRRR
jgi:hypothetical protein